MVNLGALDENEKMEFEGMITGRNAGVSVNLVLSQRISILGILVQRP